MENSLPEAKLQEAKNLYGTFRVSRRLFILRRLSLECGNKIMIHFFIFSFFSFFHISIWVITGWEGDQRNLCKTVAICCGGTDAEINNSGDYSLRMRSPRFFFLLIWEI
jgi:hypothetical protein